MLANRKQPTRRPRNSQWGRQVINKKRCGCAYPNCKGCHRIAGCSPLEERNTKHPWVHCDRLILIGGPFFMIVVCLFVPSSFVWLPVNSRGGTNTLSCDRGGGPRWKDYTQCPFDKHHVRFEVTAGILWMSTVDHNYQRVKGYHRSTTPINPDGRCLRMSAPCFIASKTNFCLSLRPNHGPQLGWISECTDPI